MDVLLLNIETSTKNCSVSLSKNGVLLSFKELNNGDYSHAEMLHPFIKLLLDDATIGFKDLSAIAVSKGPGSFTGLRIGVSAAKGLCFALDIPLIAIDSLSILAQTKQVDNGFIIPLLDARRMEVYTSVYNANFEQIEPIEAVILNENSFADYLNQGPVYFLGDGVDKFRAICNHPNAIFEINAFPSAIQMANLSYLKYKKNDIEDVAYFEPFYLKDFFIVKAKTI